jgi:hypothetical protein
MYRIHQSENKGKILVATEDLLPGVDLFSEKAILTVSVVGQVPFVYLGPAIDKAIWFGYDQFKYRTSAEDQEKILSLFGPMDTPRANNFRSEIKPYADENNWIEEETEQFVKYCMV